MAAARTDRTRVTEGSVIQLSLMKIRSNSALVAILVLVSGLATDTALVASEEGSTARSLFDSKYTLALGGFFPRVNSTLTLNSSRGGGGEISAEDDLGLDDGTSSSSGRRFSGTPVFETR